MVTDYPEPRRRKLPMRRPSETVKLSAGGIIDRMDALIRSAGGKRIRYRDLVA